MQGDELQDEHEEGRQILRAPAIELSNIWRNLWAAQDDGNLVAYKDCVGDLLEGWNAIDRDIRDRFHQHNTLLEKAEEVIIADREGTITSTPFLLKEFSIRRPNKQQ